jgi:hypothetical protein
MNRDLTVKEVAAASALSGVGCEQALSSRPVTSSVSRPSWPGGREPSSAQPKHRYRKSGGWKHQPLVPHHGIQHFNPLVYALPTVRQSRVRPTAIDHTA